MLNKLEQNRIVYFTASVFISLLICGVGYFLAPDVGFRIIWLIIFAGNLIISLRYLLCGLALGLRWGLTWLFLLLGIGVGTLLNLSNVFSDESTALAVTNILFIPLIIFLPKYLQQKVQENLTGKSKITIKDIYEHQAGFKTPTIEGVDFDTHLEYKAMARSLANPGGFHSISSSARWIRGLSTLVLFLLSLGIIITGALWIDSSNAQMFHLSPWMIAMGFGLFITCSFLLDNGFKKATLVFLGIAFFIALSYGAFLILKSALQSSVMLFTALSFLFIFFLITAFLLLRRHLSRRSATYMDFEQNGVFHWVDLYLKDTAPIKNYEWLAKIKLQVISDEVLIDELHHDLLLFAQSRRIILAGSLLRPSDQKLTLFLYGTDEKHLKKLQPWFTNKFRDAIQIDIQADKQWLSFKELLPNEATMIRLNNEWIIADLEDQDLDLNLPQPLVFTAAFEHRNQAMSLLEEVSRLPYDQAIYEDYSKYVMDEEMDLKLSHLIHVQKTMRISKAWLDIETLKFLELTQPKGGYFENIIFGTLEELELPE